MDPVTIFKVITTVLDHSGTVINYLKDVKGASEDRKRISDEIVTTQAFLFMLKDKSRSAQSDESWHKTLLSLSAPSGPLEQFKNALDRLAINLMPVDGLKRVQKALTWPFQKQEVKDILATIERQKPLFLLALQNDHT